MRELEKPVGRVWRRLRLQRFLAALVWCWAATLGLAALAIGGESLIGPLPGPIWLPFAIAGGLGLVVAALIALLTGPGRVEAAVALDRAFQLNERLSTALTLPPDLRETPAGRALLADASKHAGDLDIGSRFGLRLPRRAWVPLVPALLAVGLLFAPDWAQGLAKARPTDAQKAEDTKAVSQAASALNKKVAAQRQELDKDQFAEAERLLAEIEKATEQLAKAPPAEKDKALVELNQLSDALKDRQKQLGGAEQVARELKKLGDRAANGPGEPFARELAKGDFAKAADQLKQLQEKMASGKMSEAEKQELKDQLGAMKKELEKLANLEDRKKQLEEARKSGGLSQEQFQKEMAKLDQQAQDLKQLQQLAQKLGEAQEQMARGNMQKAAETLGMGQEQLEQMAQQLQELEALDGALADLMDAKNGMLGDDMNQLGRQLEGMNGMNGMGNRPGMGNGLGRGRGQGDRPEAPDDTASYASRVKQQYGKGKAVLEGFAPPNSQIKGESLIESVESLEADGGVGPDALSNQRIPRGVRQHILNYYDRINDKGKPR